MFKFYPRNQKWWVLRADAAHF